MKSVPATQDLYIALYFSSGWHFSIFQIKVNLQKLRFEFLFIINAACIIDGIAASETTFVYVFKA